MAKMKDRYQLDPLSRIPDVWILDSSFQKLGLIDDYTSLIWSRRYYEVGDFELYVRVTDKNMSLLNVDLSSTVRFIMRNDTKEVMRIEKVEISVDAEEGDFITASGRDLRCLLYQRCTMMETEYGELITSPITGEDETDNTVKIADVVYDLIRLNLVNPETTVIDEDGNSSTVSDTKRKMPYLTYDTSSKPSVGTAAMVISEGENVGEKIEELCNDFRIGWKAEWNGSNIVFRCYEGQDRSSTVIFSEEFANLIRFIDTEDLEDFYNVMVLLNEHTDENGVVDKDLVSFGNASGMLRFEKSFSGSEDLDVSTTTSLRDLAYTFKFPSEYKLTYQTYEWAHDNDEGYDSYAAVNYGSNTPNPRDKSDPEDESEAGRTGNDYMSSNGLVVITACETWEENYNRNWTADIMMKEYYFRIYSESWLNELREYDNSGTIVTEKGIQYYKLTNVPVGNGHVRTNYHMIQRPNQVPIGEYGASWNLMITGTYTEDGQDIDVAHALHFVGNAEWADSHGYPTSEYPDRVTGWADGSGAPKFTDYIENWCFPLSMEINLSDILVRERYMAKAYSMVEEALSTSDFEGEIAPDVNYTYREDYDIGDRIRIRTDIGIEKDVRITEAVETFDSDGYNIEVKFGV